MTMRLLLCSVFGPYGVDDDYGCKANKMELFDNQVTREQGIFSYRFHHASFGLHLLAENVEVPTTVLDFPSEGRFVREIRSGAYDYVGLSFIMPNFKKAQKMAQLVRKHAPGSKIILGGHGTAIPGVEALIEHDHICRGEGVGFLRRLFGEKPDRPIRHPLVHSSYNRRMMGVPLQDGSGVIIPGVGCPNKCRFCATSHFFGDCPAYLSTGREIFEVCCAYEDKLCVRDFGVLDENFLKMRGRAEELVACMEQSGRLFTFGIFSSAETLMALPDLDFLVRLGVNFVWLGVESKSEIYAKNRGVDFGTLVANLRRRGISVLASAILFLEHHDRETIWEDVDYAVGLNPDYLQFMGLGPIPGTPLYDGLARSGLLNEEIPFAQRHGQDAIWFHHPSFDSHETGAYLAEAFRRDYVANGASFARFLTTTLNGFRYAKGHPDPRVQRRAADFEAMACKLRPFLLAGELFSENRATTKLFAELGREYGRLFGPLGLKDRLGGVAVVAFALRELLKAKLAGSARQPPTRRTVYGPKNRALAPIPLLDLRAAEG
jgi:radical SAM superfamily enzyme YgiQ (UPF0313 family)